MIGTRFPGGADVQSDATIEHGTPEGYEAGCKGIGCPAGLDENLRFSCARAWSLSVSDYRYSNMRRAGATVAEMAAAFDISAMGKAPTPPVLTKPTKTTTPKKASQPVPSKETPMPSIAELAPEIADQLTQAAVTASADEAATKPRSKAEETAARRLEPKRKSEADRLAQETAEQATPPAEKPITLAEVVAAPKRTVTLQTDRVAEVAAKNLQSAPVPDAPVLDASAREPWHYEELPSSLSDVELAAEQVMQGMQVLTDALSNQGHVHEGFRSSVARTLQAFSDENAELRARLARLEADVKPAAAIARALATIETGAEA